MTDRDKLRWYQQVNRAFLESAKQTSRCSPTIAKETFA